MHTEETFTQIETLLNRTFVQIQIIQETMEVGENHPLHIERIIITPEEEVLATIETIPKVEMDQPRTDPIPEDETIITIESDSVLRAETVIETTDPTPVDEAVADPGTRNPALEDEITTRTDNLNGTYLLLNLADLLLQQQCHTSSKVGVRNTSTANS